MPSSPFLVSLYRRLLGLPLGKHGHIKGIALPGGNDIIIDCEFADDSNWYLEDMRENLANMKSVLNILATAEGARIN